MAYNSYSAANVGPNFRGPLYGWDVPAVPAGGMAGVYPTQTGSIGGPLAGTDAARGPLSGSGGGFLSGLRGLLDPQYALPIAAQLIGGATPQASFAGALNAAGPAIGDMRKRAAINAWLRSRSTGEPLSPEIQQYIAQDPALAQKLAEHDMGLDAGAGSGDYGLNPIYGVDASGNAVVMQPKRSGGLAPAALPEGVTLSKKPIEMDAGTEIVLLDPVTRQVIGRVPKNLAGAASQTAQGAAQGAAQADLPRAVHAADTMIETIDQALADPEAISAVTGPIQSHLPNVTALANRGQSYIDKIQGGTFLQAYAVLKGGGQITEIEGAKAEAALNRLRSTGMSDTDYVAALKEFRTEVLRLAEIAKQRAQGGEAGAAPAGAPAGAPAAGAADPLGIR